MLDKITIRQLYEWSAYHEVEPFDEQRADLRAARICHILVNQNRKKGAAPVPLEKFMPQFDKAYQKRTGKRRRNTETTDQEIERKMTLMVRALSEVGKGKVM